MGLVTKRILRFLSQLTDFRVSPGEDFTRRRVTLELIKASIISTSLQKNHVLEILGRVKTELSPHIFSEEVQYLRCVDN